MTKEAAGLHSGYDLIGDVHGCARTLVRLLELLGYRRRHGVYRHPSRQAIFVGDIVDRGPRIREALHLVRDMVEAGAAQMVLGNHEYNAITYSTRRPGTQEEFLRDHSHRHRRQIRETLDQFAAYPEEWAEFLRWFRRLPLFMEFEHFRVVHACWDAALIAQLRQLGVVDLRDDEFLIRSTEPGRFEWKVLDRLTRGTYLPLPNGEEMVSKDGYRRRVYRTKFWASRPERHIDVVFQPDPLPEHIARMPLRGEDRARLLSYGAEELPLFIGHYWRDGVPAPIRPNIACLDYSAVKYGKLVAYRMDSETCLHPDKFVWVDVEP